MSRESYVFNKVNIDGIIRGVAEVYDVKPEQIKGRGRTGIVAEARQVAMCLTWKALGGVDGCQSETGRLFDREHGTVQHALKAVRDKLDYHRPTQIRWRELSHLAVPEEHDHDYMI